MWRELQEAGVIGAVDRHLAAWLGRVGGDEVVQLAGALASHATRQGHVCVDLAGLVGPVHGDDGEVVEGLVWPDWGTVGDSELVGSLGDGTPLVREGTRIYLQRYHDHEQALATSLCARAEPVAVDEARLARMLARCYPDADPRAADQRHACEVAARQRLTVVSGGPGTGKTTTVARLLAVVGDQRAAQGLGARVRLLAPTGKAATRMVEALRREVERLDPGLRAGLPDSASTVHRALSPVRGSRTHFRRGPDAPLPEDIVVVDEASMVDLAMMRRLAQAVRPDAHLVLLGDRHQLASVESGAVLGEVARGALGHPEHPLARGVVQLQHSFRFDDAGGIGGLAHAVRTGDVAKALRVLDEGHDVRWMPRPAPHRLGSALEALVRQGFEPLCEGRSPQAAVAALDQFRVLCAHRRGPWGVESLNGQIERALADGRLLAPGPGWYPQRPVLVTSNDYRLELFNGDQGVTVATPSGLRAVFPTEGGVRSVAPSRLADVQTVFALSVHKSQGSEFERVVVVLPEVGSPLLTRELLYTAITRARKQVVVVGEPASLRAAIDTPVVRMSGLQAKLYGAAAGR